MSLTTSEIKCSTCNEVKPTEQFSRNSSTRTGYQLRCKSCVKAHYLKNADTIKRRVNNYQKEKALDPLWVEKERKRKTELTRRRYWENPEKHRQWSSGNKKKNRARYTEAQRVRGANLRNQFKNLSEFDRARTQIIYKVRERLSELTGEVWHVDHIIPLKGKTVCGLHVPSNLRVIPARENMRKHNKLIAFESEKL